LLTLFVVDIGLSDVFFLFNTDKGFGPPGIFLFLLTFSSLSDVPFNFSIVSFSDAVGLTFES
jgi:hypothetical protein